MTSVTRRTFLTGLGTFGAGLGTLGVSAFVSGCRSAGPAPSAAAANANASAKRIDVHHHIGPPSWNAEMKARQPGLRLVFEWTPAKSIEDMDRGGVATAMTSITQPGVWFGDVAKARRLARECNDYAARLARDHSGRFGVWAVMPMPDVEGTLREIEYALDTLKTEGIAFLTNFGDKWLGDPAFTPVMEELNRRKAVVYTHPTTANCCGNLVPDVPDAIVEWGTDTTRTIASLVFSGTASRFPDIRFIFSHGGGTLPFLTGRFTGLAMADKKFAARLPNGVLYELRKFHYDTAQVAHPMALASLVKLVPVSQVVFGTDYPFRTSAEHVKGLSEYGFSASDLRAIDRGNAERLVPRLKT
jgi:predicted TIM-barrel fold metal-dependent hydrolase